MIRGLEFIGGRLAINVLGKNPENAADIVRAAGPAVLVGMVVKGRSAAEAIADVEQAHALGVPVSVGLGAGDPSVWRLAAEVALATRPAHLNQVFPTALYTLGRLADQPTVVNALISPTGSPGQVRLSVGPLSSLAEPAIVAAETAAAILAEAGIPSVKFFPLNGAWDELDRMARAAVRYKIPLFEPTGGLDQANLAQVTQICLDAGCQYVIPHVYSAVVDRATGLTQPDQVAKLVEILQSLI